VRNKALIRVISLSGRRCGLAVDFSDMNHVGCFETEFNKDVQQ